MVERFRICWQGADTEPHRGVWFVGKRDAAEAIVVEQNRVAANVEYWLEAVCDHPGTQGEWHVERIDDNQPVQTAGKITGTSKRVAGDRTDLA